MADEGMNGFMQLWDNPEGIDLMLEALEAARLEIFVEE